MSFGGTEGTIIDDDAASYLIRHRFRRAAQGTVDVAVTTPFGNSGTSSADQIHACRRPTANAVSYTLYENSSIEVSTPGVSTGGTDPQSLPLSRRNSPAIPSFGSVSFGTVMARSTTPPRPATSAPTALPIKPSTASSLPIRRQFRSRLSKTIRWSLK